MQVRVFDHYRKGGSRHDWQLTALYQFLADTFCLKRAHENVKPNKMERELLMNAKPKILRIALILSLCLLGRATYAQRTAFTYQGQLLINGNPADGLYDIRAGLFTTNTGGTVFAGPITNTAVSVSNGLFTIALDYGNVFDGNTFWLQVAVRTNGSGAFTVLSPRQQLTPAPYAIFAE